MMKNIDILRNKPNPFDFFFQRVNAMMQVWFLNPVSCMTWNAMHFRQGVSLYAYMGILDTPSGCTCNWGPFQGATLTPQMEMFNGSMSSVRVSVEWLFGDILNYFKFLDFKKNLKIGLSNIGKTYVVCALMRNALTCLYGNQTSEFFELEPPSLQEYFRWPKTFAIFTGFLPEYSLKQQ